MVNNIDERLQCIELFESFKFPQEFIQRILEEDNYTELIHRTKEIKCIENSAVQFIFIIYTDDDKQSIKLSRDEEEYKWSSNFYSAITANSLGFGDAEQLYNRLLEVKTFLEIVHE